MTDTMMRDEAIHETALLRFAQRNLPNDGLEHRALEERVQELRDCARYGVGCDRLRSVTSCLHDDTGVL